MDVRLIVTPKEASEMLKTRVEYIYEKLEQGDIPAYKTGTTWKIPYKALENYVMELAAEESRQRREINER